MATIKKGITMNVDDIKYIAAAKSDVINSDTTRLAIFNQAFEHACGWYESLPKQQGNYSKKKLRKEAYSYVYSRMDKPSGFLPSVIWWWIARSIITWIVQKIIDHIFKD